MTAKKAPKKTTKPEKKARTQVCFLLDETQSMLARKQETIQGFNGYLADLKKDKGDEVLFTFTTFNKGGIKTPYKATPVADVKPLNDQTYNPQNWTPLYDAIGKTVCDIEAAVKDDDLVIFTILTDGEENSSLEYTRESVKDLLAKCEKKGWKVVFLGVGIDAFQGARQIGISAANAFDVAPQNAQAMYSNLSAGTASLRSSNAMYGARAQATVSMSVLSEKDRKELKSTV